MSRSPQGTHRQFRALPEIRPSLSEALSEPKAPRKPTVVHGPKVRAAGAHPAVKFPDAVVLEVRRLGARMPPHAVHAAMLAAGYDIPMHSVNNWLSYTTRAHLTPDSSRITTYLTTPTP